MSGSSGGTGAANNPNPPQGGQIGLANANANMNFDFGSMFENNNSYSRFKRNMREGYRQLGKYGANANRKYQMAHIKGVVKGAQKAGMHPLFAMGGGTNMPAPSYVGESLRGRDYGIQGQTSVQTASPAEQQAMHESEARARLMNAQADEIYGRLLDSVAARGRQGSNATQDERKVAEGKFVGFRLPGGGMSPAGESADAQDWEQRYWEIGGAAGALINIGGDAVGAIPESVWDKFLQLDNSYRQWKKRNDRRTNYDYLNVSP